MLQKLHDFAFRYFFSAEQERLKKETDKYKRLNANFSVARLVRSQLKGFDTSVLSKSVWDGSDNAISIEDAYEVDESRDAFLAKVHDLAQSKELEGILTYLVRNQILFTAKEAVGVEQELFGRATINGLTLVRDEIRRLDAMYRSEHAPKESFDKFSVT